MSQVPLSSNFLRLPHIASSYLFLDVYYMVNFKAWTGFLFSCGCFLTFLVSVFRKCKLSFKQVDSLQLCCEKSCCLLTNNAHDSGLSTVHHFGCQYLFPQSVPMTVYHPMTHPFPDPPAALYLLEPQPGMPWWTELCIANALFLATLS